MRLTIAFLPVFSVWVWVILRLLRRRHCCPECLRAARHVLMVSAAVLWLSMCLAVLVAERWGVLTAKTYTR